MACTYDCTLRWRDGLTSRLVASAGGFESREAARRACETIARGAGWRPRSWWEVWRLGETWTYTV